MSTLIHLQDDFLQQMELDLVDKAQAAFVAAGLSANVHGVFSIDDLENKLENDLSKRIGVGVAYHQSAPLELDSNAKASAAPGQGIAVRMVRYEFLVVLAVPTGDACMERYNATQLLTVLRRHIHGSTVAGDAGQRRWGFLKETPRMDQSTETMLYYTQSWAVALPLVGPK